MTTDAILLELTKLGDLDRARLYQSFFKTGPGQYGEGDRFLGIMVPEMRRFLRKIGILPLEQVAELLQSPWHEARFLAVISLTNQAKREKDPTKKEALFDWYWQHRAGINNWDLVDVSVPTLLGGLPLTVNRRTFAKKIIKSPQLWERRMAMIATLGWLKQGEEGIVAELAAELLQDTHDLMHKAAGWCLRELGKKNERALRGFLDAYTPRMPRTMLRYAIERFSLEERKRYLAIPREKKA